MEAAEETLTYRDDTGLHRKLLREDKHKDNTDSKGHAETKSDESNYVDLDMKPDGTKTVKVTFTGEGNQLSVIKCDSARQGEHGTEGKIISEDFVEEQSEDKRATGCGPLSGESLLETLTKLPNTDPDSENEKQRQQAELDASDCSEHVCSESDELQYTDMYLNSKTESDDGASAVLSDHCGSDTLEDESHYITTHEIQLTELDHDVDYDLGRGTCWDFEDDNLVYSFVDYASFESDETQEGTLILEGRSQAKLQSNLGGAVVSTEQEESDLCDSDKGASSDESVCKNESGDAGAGKIHLSIKTSSRAVNEPGNIFDNSTCGYTKHFGDGSHFSFVSSGARAGPLCDRAQYFIPAPGRQHLATKLRRKDINEYSSGASSSISELDDADKEVRNLTAKSFRSLACPYFDAINLSTSSESSMSEYGLNKWSAYVDWNYGNISRGKERSVIAHKTSSATLEMNKTVDSKRHGKTIASSKASQTKTYAPNKRTNSQQASSSSKKIELKDPVHPKQRGVTLNFRCNVAPEGAKRPKSSKNARSSEVTGAVLASSVLQTSATMKSSKTPVAPLSVKIEPQKHGQVEQRKVKISPTNPTVTQGSLDSENYLTMPGLGYTNEIKLLNREPVSKEANSNSSQTHTGDSKKSPLIMEYPASTVYHHPAAAATAGSQTQQVLCFSPTVTTVSPTPSTGETISTSQRKMLLDPTTGHYYLVDTPIQPTTKRLFDPETGHYVDVPMPHSPAAPVTPVPLPLSPVALNPGAYAPTYMIYPGFIPSPTLPAQAVLPQSACHSEDAGGEKVKNARSTKHESNATGGESIYYSATGEAPLQLPVSLGHVSARGSAASTDRKPVISITTQQGPRIIAPPSFDGTTMSFVVEHR
eukprot:superscaffoldBa00000007_g160